MYILNIMFGAHVVWYPFNQNHNLYAKTFNVIYLISQNSIHSYY